jgi:hypothetical protein
LTEKREKETFAKKKEKKKASYFSFSKEADRKQSHGLCHPDHSQKAPPSPIITIYSRKS